MDEDLHENAAMIACATFEVSKIIEPLRFHGTRRIHIIHYVKDNSEKNSIYQEFYDEVCRQITDIGGVEIIEHVAKVYDYATMLSTIVRIFREETADLIRVNISSGTSEYAAAAMMASSMYSKAQPFSVRTREYSVDQENLRDLYSVDGRLVGLTKTVYGPKPVESFSVLAPDFELVRCLGILQCADKDKVPATAAYMIDRLKCCGAWSYVPESRSKRTPLEQRETMYYKRHYVDNLLAKGWIRKDAGKTRYSLTSDGKAILNVFGSLLSS